MSNRLISFSRSNGDLKPYDEYWATDTFDERKSKIFTFIKKLTYFPPSSNMSYIRDVSFSVRPTITLEDLRRFADLIRQEYIIDCFQISIDRTKNLAYMMFDFVNRQTGKIVELSISDHRYMLSKAFKFVGQADKIPDEMLRYFIVSEYKYDPSIFRRKIEELKHLHLSKNDFRLTRNSLLFMERYCRQVLDKTKSA